ncbi:MAG: amidohydrolase family protein [Rhodospirillales bacterium]|nr:amidohydrolase family protein [Rhodospirillales bacterium]
MPIIDSDAHVIETPETWSYLSKAERKFEPMIVTRKTGSEEQALIGRAIREYWVVDNYIMPKDLNVGPEATPAAREMRDIPGRLAHMDALNIDIQVLYPTIFLRPCTTNPEVEYALCRAYNRWLGDIWKQAPDRLRWVAVPPVLSMHKMAEELEFARDNGAVGVMLRGLECDRMLSDPYFYPLYDIASELGLAVCPHSATNSFLMYDLYHDDPGFNKFKLATIGAAHSLMWHGIPEKFPKINWGFVEVSAQWIPYLLNDLGIRLRRRGIDMPDDMLEKNNIFVACQVTDDLDYVLRYSGENTLVIGTDYGHADTATEIDALRKIRDDGRIAPHVIDRILDDNACALYGLG